jgi:hypothetical protein
MSVKIDRLSHWKKRKTLILCDVAKAAGLGCCQEESNTMDTVYKKTGRERSST